MRERGEIEGGFCHPLLHQPPLLSLPRRGRAAVAFFLSSIAWFSLVFSHSSSSSFNLSLSSSLSNLSSTNRRSLLRLHPPPPFSLHHIIFGITSSSTSSPSAATSSASGGAPHKCAATCGSTKTSFPPSTPSRPQTSPPSGSHMTSPDSGTRTPPASALSKILLAPPPHQPLLTGGGFISGGNPTSTFEFLVFNLIIRSIVILNPNLHPLPPLHPTGLLHPTPYPCALSPTLHRSLLTFAASRLLATLLLPIWQTPSSPPTLTNPRPLPPSIDQIPLL